MPEDFWQYCWEMERDGTWGDHVTLQAAADAYGVPINILTSYQDSCFVNLTPRPERASDRALYVSFFAEVHYNSLYPAGVQHDPCWYLHSLCGVGLQKRHLHVHKCNAMAVSPHLLTRLWLHLFAYTSPGA